MPHLLQLPSPRLLCLSPDAPTPAPAPITTPSAATPAPALAPVTTPAAAAPAPATPAPPPSSPRPTAPAYVSVPVPLPAPIAMPVPAVPATARLPRASPHAEPAPGRRPQYAHAWGELSAPERPPALTVASTSMGREACRMDELVYSVWVLCGTFARLALSRLVPPVKRVHFRQPLIMPFLFPDLLAFSNVADPITQLRYLDASFRVTCTTDELAEQPPPLPPFPFSRVFLTLHLLATRLHDRYAPARDALLAMYPSPTEIETPLCTIASTTGTVVAAVAVPSGGRCRHRGGHSCGGGSGTSRGADDGSASPGGADDGSASPGNVAAGGAGTGGAAVIPQQQQPYHQQQQ
ncbi:unnamed protein product [Closterium sp. NIES-53]